MHRVRVVSPRYEQSQPFLGREGEVVGHWGPENSEEGREGFLVQFEGGEVVGLAEDEVEDVPGE